MKLELSVYSYNLIMYAPPPLATEALHFCIVVQLLKGLNSAINDK